LFFQDLLNLRQAVTCAATSAGVLYKNTTHSQFLNIPQCCVIRTLGQFGIFGCVHIPPEIIFQHEVDDEALPFIDWFPIDPVPKLRFE
jgi:hypothetical protein